MRRATVRFVLITAVLSFAFPAAPIKGQPEADALRQKYREELVDASNELSKQISPIKSRDLQGAARKLVDAANQPEKTDQLKTAADDLESALKAARARAAEQNKPFSERDGVKAIDRAVSAARTFASLPPPKVDANKTSKDTDHANVNKLGNDDESLPFLSGWMWPVLLGLAAVALLVVTGFLILRLRRGYWARFDHHVNGIVKANTKELMQRQDELAKHFVALGNQHRSGSARLESIEGELQALGRRARAMSDGRGYQGDSGRNSDNDSSRPQPPVEPEFPASVDEYLNKMKRNSTVVKPDFQNGILVSDLDGRGELVLIRDTSLADGAQPLFLVPRVGQFQTKQEFHSYYERYYECQRPSAGDVWIIDPAVVSTVPGGWELREKGVLEVR